MDRELILYPSSNLEITCEKVTDPSEWDDLRELMAQLLYEKNGIGLAAPQLGESIQLFLLRLHPDRRLHEAYFNPEIKSIIESEPVIEGCLSFPNIEVEIERPTHLTFSALTPGGEKVERTVKGLQAQCVQHEIDHLRGKTLLDHCDLAQKIQIQEKLKMLEEGKIPPPPDEESGVR